MGMSKSKVGAATAGPSKQYMKKGGTAGKKKMMTGGMANPNKAAKASPMKKGGMYKKGGMKKGM